MGLNNLSARRWIGNELSAPRQLVNRISNIGFPELNPKVRVDGGANICRRATGERVIDDRNCEDQVAYHSLNFAGAG